MGAVGSGAELGGLAALGHALYLSQMVALPYTMIRLKRAVSPQLELIPAGAFVEPAVTPSMTTCRW
ncbi:hypothetical protein FHS43_005781 [Streptosporangium becharense]|uniref:Uncharacterized protein n=1 Tax=Streptosporangium becharense TaxID=1816182 RepID=A0A7W9MKH2_9ACTN|nr:hypothetical protein [Streptosporangium becharense]MBB5823499.1 hypothetical protein [Streptosporangium becharense]